MAYRSFEELQVWKRSCQLAIEIYKVLKECRDYGLRDQMTRAAVSIPSNIAEGCERESVKEFIHFLHIAKGSAAELRTQLNIAKEIGIVPGDISKTFIVELKEISSMLQGLVKSIKLPT
jgi:four helix bundle protein